MQDTTNAPQPAAADAPAFEWAIVEIFGHRRHAGRAREEERFGSKMLRVDVPVVVVDPEPSPEGLPIVRIERYETHFYGGSAIFSYTLTDEASVMRANRPYERPAPYRLAPPDDEPDPVDASFVEPGGDDDE
jgi:hypothetical protein